MAARVVDASVLAAKVFGEPRADEADALLQGADLYAPELLAYELAKPRGSRKTDNLVRAQEADDECRCLPPSKR